MRCPCCKYEHDGKWISEGYKNIIGDQRFISIYIEHKVKIDNPREYEDGDYNYQDKIEVELIACPKCKTVILNESK